MSEFVPRGTPKVRFWPKINLFATARPMTPEEQACDCGCEDVEREPATDLTYQATEEPPAAGVSNGYVVLRNGDEADVAEAALLHDGDGGASVQIDHTTWKRTVIRDQ